MIVYGGRTTPEPTTTAILSEPYEYCPATNAWTALNATGPGVRYGHAAVEQAGRMLVFAGYSGLFPDDFLSA
jgi:N-acetylneuraminic acid mutarotase